MLWWTKDLAIGVDSIDQEHQAVFEKADEIFNFEDDTPASKVKEAFSFLVQYVNKHFSEEEKLMLQYHYPEVEKHRKHHRYLVDELHTITKEIGLGGIDQQLIDRLKLLIVEWLVSHINEEDKKMVSHIKGQGATL